MLFVFQSIQYFNIAVQLFRYQNFKKQNKDSVLDGNDSNIYEEPISDNQNDNQNDKVTNSYEEPISPTSPAYVLPNSLNIYEEPINNYVYNLDINKNEYDLAVEK